MENDPVSSFESTPQKVQDLTLNLLVDILSYQKFILNEMAFRESKDSGKPFDEVLGEYRNLLDEQRGFLRESIFEKYGPDLGGDILKKKGG